MHSEKTIILKFPPLDKREDVVRGLGEVNSFKESQDSQIRRSPLYSLHEPMDSQDVPPLVRVKREVKGMEREVEARELGKAVILDTIQNLL